MKNTLVRKFQLPPEHEVSPQSGAPTSATAPQPPQESPHATDLHIPEINTTFIDNLFTDPTFVDRFDVAFGQTVPMGLDMEMNPPVTRTEPGGAVHEWDNLLDISFPKPTPK
jgi:hypothetical protein